MRKTKFLILYSWNVLFVWAVSEMANSRTPWVYRPAVDTGAQEKKSVERQ